MTGEELRTKAINGARGVVSWGKLSAAGKGMWNNAAMEVEHEKDRLLTQVVLHERESIIAFLRAKHGELTKDMDPQRHMHIYVLATGMVDAAAMLERGEHT